VAARPDVDDDRVRRHLVLGHLVDRHGAAVGDIRRVDRLVVDEQSARDRVHAVGRDDHLGLLDVPVGERGRRAGGGVLVADAGLVGEQLDAGPLAGAQEDPVQVAAVDDHVGEAVRALKVDQVQPGQLGPVGGVLHDHRLAATRRGSWPHRAARSRRASGCSSARSAARRPTSPNSLARSKQPHPQPLAGQGERRAQPTDAAADDDDVRTRCGLTHADLLGRSVCSAVKARRPGWGWGCARRRGSRSVPRRHDRRGMPCTQPAVRRR
jgi:hypothetical protein